MTKSNFAITGRARWDDEASTFIYNGMTHNEACMAFERDLLDGKDADHEYSVDAVVESATPIYRHGKAPARMPQRIVIEVSGGVAETVDAEAWPDGLELFIVDRDNSEGADDEADLCHVDGPCTIDRIDADTARSWEQMTGHFAAKVAEAYQED
ncbi:hypothetical protein [Oceaniradius stylonematis]|uniref:hypothetical protein n=1 Tax=Oceaniradius stylonematis TaxID=2184161 RepID=UPI00273F5A38|nr:hypothetical protein [Oceaniradius stylonematis]